MSKGVPLYIEEQKKKKVIRRLVLSISMILLLPTVFALTFLLLSSFGISINSVLFVWTAGKTSRIIGVICGVGIYIALAMWLLKQNYSLASKIVVLLIALAILLSVSTFALYFYSFMTDPGYR